MIAPAPAKINLALVVGPLRADGLHEVVTVSSGSTSPTAIDGRAAPTSCASRVRRRHARPARARRARRGRDGWRARIEKRIPVAAGLGGGSSDAATALRLANEHARRAARRAERCTRSPHGLGADVPFFLARGPAARDRRRDRRSSRSTCRRTTPCCSLLPRGAQQAVDGRGLRRFDGATARGFDERARRCSQRSRACAGRATSPRCRRTTSRRSPLADELRALGAFRADVSGAGPAVYGLFDDRRRGARARALERARAGLDRSTCVVRLIAMYGAHAIEHGIEPAAVGCARSGCGSRSGSPSSRACSASSTRSAAGRSSRSRRSPSASLVRRARQPLRHVRAGRWILAASQLLVVSSRSRSPSSKALAIGVIALLAIVALIFLLHRAARIRLGLRRGA